MDTNMVPAEPGMTLEIAPIWEQRQHEGAHEYAWFVRYAELGEGRTLEKTAKLQGVPVALVRKAAERHGWPERAAAFDATVVSIQQAVTVDETEALAVQYGAGMMMLKLGLQAIQIKNPALLKVKDISQLLQMGSEMVRRGAGVADLKIEHDVVKRVQSDLELLLGD